MAKKADNESDKQADKFHLVVGKVVTKHNKKRNVDEGEALVSIGALPIIYSKLATPSHPTENDKYAVMFSLTKAQRTEVIEKLAPIGVEIAAIRGIKLTLKEVESTLRQKLSELEEPDTFKLVSDQRVAFAREDGLSIVQLPVFGPDDEILEKPYLTNGSEGYANFLMTCVVNPETKKANFPFRLKAVKVSTVVLYEREETDRPSYDDFTQVQSPY